MADRYEAAVKYHAAHGNLDVPTEYIDEDGILLGKWVSRQRYAWQNPERSSARVTLERKALLDELGMNWEKTDSQNWLVKSWNSRRTPNCPSWETYFQRNYILY